MWMNWIEVSTRSQLPMAGDRGFSSVAVGFAIERVEQTQYAIDFPPMNQ